MFLFVSDYVWWILFGSTRICILLALRSEVKWRIYWSWRHTRKSSRGSPYVRMWCGDLNWTLWNNSVQKFFNTPPPHHHHSNCHKQDFSLILQFRCWKAPVLLFLGEALLYNKQITYKQNAKAINKQNHVNKPLTTLARLLRKHCRLQWSVYLWMYQHVCTSLTFQTTGHDLTHFLYKAQAEALVERNQSQRGRFAFRKLTLQLTLYHLSFCLHEVLL
jgi:hypothetical protein